MNQIYTLTSLILVFFCTTNAIAQKEKFKGQAPIKIVPTNPKPVQKQWRGDFILDEGSLVFTNDFDGGRLNGLLKINDTTYSALITSENTPVNMSPWYAFKIWSEKKRTIYLNLTYQQGAKHRYYPKVSPDGHKWKLLDSTRYLGFDREPTGNRLPTWIQMKLEVGKDTLWMAAQELNTSQHVLDWVTKIAAKRNISKGVLGKSREGRHMPLLSIGKPRSKKMVMVISRQHPPEVTGYLAMQSFVETISGDTRLAKRFRRKYTTYVVPLMNPDGVDNGHWRHNNGGIDLNRDWAQFNHPETRAVRDFMAERVKNTKGKFYFGIDFHSTWDDIYYTLDEQYKGNMPGLVPEWLEAIKGAIPNYDPNIRPSDKLEPTAVSRNYFFKVHGAEALVFEIGDRTDRDFIKEKGRVAAEKLMELLLDAHQ